MFNPFGMNTILEDMMTLIRSLSEEVISSRVRMRALLEIMEEKGLLAPGEFDERAAAVWERDYDELSKELMSQPQSSLGVGTAELISMFEENMGMSPEDLLAKLDRQAGFTEDKTKPE